jgi:UDP-N-acetylmuramate dehydrogenase
MEILSKLKEKLGENIKENVPLAPYTTYRLGGPARYFFVAKSVEEIKQAAKAAKECNLPIFILGGGSNILISDSGFDGLAIKIENKELSVDGNKIKAGAGVMLGQIVALALQNSLSGLEWAAGIPGTIGGAVRGNAGAFGKSTGDTVSKALALDISEEEAKTTELTQEQCEFDYRESIFKKNNNFIVLEVELVLELKDKTEVQKQMAENIKSRANSHPKFPSAGCSFKNIIVTPEIKEKIKAINPEGEQKIKGGKIGAGWFIDQAGLKGYKIGGAQVSAEHANFVVKTDDTARAEDIVMLISYVKQQVRDKFGVQLQEEVQYVGF